MSTISDDIAEGYISKWYSVWASASIWFGDNGSMVEINDSMSVANWLQSDRDHQSNCCTIHYLLHNSYFCNESVASFNYLGWKSQSAIQSVCPSPVIMMSPLGMDHIFQFWSSLTVAKICFRGWRAILITKTRRWRTKKMMNVMKMHHFLYFLLEIVLWLACLKMLYGFTDNYW